MDVDKNDACSRGGCEQHFSTSSFSKRDPPSPPLEWDVLVEGYSRDEGSEKSDRSEGKVIWRVCYLLIASIVVGDVCKLSGGWGRGGWLP